VESRKTIGRIPGVLRKTPAWGVSYNLESGEEEASDPEG